MASEIKNNLEQKLESLKIAIKNSAIQLDKQTNNLRDLCKRLETITPGDLLRIQEETMAIEIPTVKDGIVLDERFNNAIANLEYYKRELCGQLNFYIASPSAFSSFKTGISTFCSLFTLLEVVPRLMKEIIQGEGCQLCIHDGLGFNDYTLDKNDPFWNLVKPELRPQQIINRLETAISQTATALVNSVNKFIALLPKLDPQKSPYKNIEAISSSEITAILNEIRAIPKIPQAGRELLDTHMRNAIEILEDYKNGGLTYAEEQLKLRRERGFCGSLNDICSEIEALEYWNLYTDTTQTPPPASWYPMSNICVFIQRLRLLPLLQQIAEGKGSPFSIFDEIDPPLLSENSPIWNIIAPKERPETKANNVSSPAVPESKASSLQANVLIATTQLTDKALLPTLSASVPRPLLPHSSGASTVFITASLNARPFTAAITTSNSTHGTAILEQAWSTTHPPQANALTPISSSSATLSSHRPETKSSTSTTTSGSTCSTTTLEQAWDTSTMVLREPQETKQVFAASNSINEDDFVQAEDSSAERRIRRMIPQLRFTGTESDSEKKRRDDARNRPEAALDSFNQIERSRDYLHNFLRSKPTSTRSAAPTLIRARQ